MPKFIWWKIWLARNDLIFYNKISKPEIVALKAKAFLLEVVGNPHIDDIKLEAEYKWLGLVKEDQDQLDLCKPVIKPIWHIRIAEKEFSEWWQMKNKVSIFFDGASKGNLRKVGVGSLIFYPGGKLETSFSWGVGKLTNNQVKLYALLKACQLAKAAGHNNIQFFWKLRNHH